MQGQGILANYKNILNIKGKSEFPCFYNLKNKIFPIFDNFDLENKKIALAVSGGADSMIVAVLIIAYYEEKNFNLQNINIVHCNHKVRLESEDEAKIMSDFFKGLNYYYFERVENIQQEDENSLRNWRYSKFSGLCKELNLNYFFVGHHLNDRVESTLLNLMRGANINGFLNMKTKQQHPLLPEFCEVCRPLLGISKTEILKVCKEIGLKYFEDKTNYDSEISKRNRIRNQILNPLCNYKTENGNENNFLKSFSNIYEEIETLEKMKKNFDIKSILETVPSFPSRNAEFSYKLNYDLKLLDKDILIQVFDFCRLRYYISNVIIDEYLSWLKNNKTGNKYFHGVNFMLHEGVLYLIKSTRDFWKREKKYEKLTVHNMEDISYYGFDLNIPRDELIGTEIRLPQDGDSFSGKSWHRRALNQKIPMWRRDWIPLAIKDNKVIHMWKNIWK